MCMNVAGVGIVALLLAACEAGFVPTPAAPSTSPAAETPGSPVPTMSPPVGTRSATPTARLTARSGPGTWTTVVGDALASMPAAALASGGRVVLLDAVSPRDRAACSIPVEGSAPVPEPPVASVFDPADGTFNRSGELDSVRTGFADASLPDGRVLVAGGYNDQGVPTSSTRISNVTTGRWAEGPLMTIARARPVAATLHDGRVLIVGGAHPSTTAEIYNPASDRWTPTGSLPWSNDSVSAVTLATGDVLAVSVTDLDAAAILVALYHPPSGEWREVARPPRSVGQPVALPDGTVLFFDGLAGVQQADADVAPLQTRNVLRYDPASRWSEAGTLLAGRAGAAAALLEDGRVLLAGGYAGDPAKGTARAVKTSELFDPRTGKSSEAAAMPRPRLDGEAVRLKDGSVLVVGGVEDVRNVGTVRCPTVAEWALRWAP